MLAATPLYWNPSAAAAANSPPTWDTTTPEWTTDSAGTSAKIAWNNNGDANGAFQAVFAAGSGTVAVKTTNDAMFVWGISFSSSGYALTGGAGAILRLSSGQIDVAAGDSAIIGVPISGGAMTKTGGGTLTLTAANTYQASRSSPMAPVDPSTIISAGTLQIGNNGTTGTMGNGDVSLLTGSNLTFDRSDNPTFYNNITLSVGTESINVLGSPTTLAGVISGPGYMAFNLPPMDDSELSLSAANTFSGNTSVVSGSLNLTGAGSLDSTTVSVSAGATLSATTGALNSLTHLNDSGVVLLSDPAPLDNPILPPGQSLDLTGNGVLNISGGTLNIKGVDTYIGITDVNSGTLSLQNNDAGTGAGSVVVNSGSTLDGNGSTSGGVTVNYGGILDPGIGNATSVLETGSVMLNTGSTFNVAVHGTVAGSGYDQLKVAGRVVLSSGSILSLSGSPTPNPGSQIVIIQNDGAFPVYGTFAGLPEGAQVTLNGAKYKLSYAGGDGNDVVLTDITPPLAAPSGLTSINTASTQASLSWNYNAATEAGFNVYLSQDGGSFALLDTVPAGDGTDPVYYTAANLTPGDSYSFYVNAFSKTQISANSLPVTVQLPANDNGPFSIIGPSQSAAGQPINLFTTGGTTSASTKYVWSIQKDGFPYASSETQYYSFTPRDSGTYTARCVQLDGSGGAIAAPVLAINVTAAPLSLTINGPTLTPGGHAVSFSSTINPPPAAGQVTYSWSVTGDAYPQGVAGPSSHAPVLRFTPTFDGTAGDSVNNYLIHLTVSVQGQSTTVTQAVTTTIDPGTSAFEFTTTAPAGDTGGSIQEAGLAMVAQPDGYFLQAGIVGSDLTTTVAVVRYTPGLKLDPYFGAGSGRVILPIGVLNDTGSFPLVKIALAPDGKILVISGSESAATADNPMASRWEVVRLNADGSLDQSFGSGGVQQIAATGRWPTAVTVLDDGSILIGGAGSQYVGQDPVSHFYIWANRWMLAKLTESGNLDPSFGSGTGIVQFSGVAPADTQLDDWYHGENIQAISVEPSGNIIVAGSMQLPNNPGSGLNRTGIALATLLPNGAPLSSFGGNTGRYDTSIPYTSGFVFDRSSFELGGMVVQADGKIVLSEDRNSIGVRIVRYNPDGTLDAGFGAAGTGKLDTGLPSAGNPFQFGGFGGLAEDNAGNVIASIWDGNWLLVRYTSAGILDTSFGAEGDGIIAVNMLDGPIGGQVVATADGIVAVGNCIVGGNDNFVIIRYHAPYETSQNLTATVLGDNNIALRWMNTGDSQYDGTAIYRAIDNGSTPIYSEIANVGPGAVTYLDQAAAPGTKYDYYVVPFAGTGFEGQSNIATATTVPQNTGYVLQDVVPVTLFGNASPLNPSFRLVSGATYLIVAEGVISQTKDGAHRADAEYGGYSLTDLSAQGYDYGIGIDDIAGVKSTYWGPVASDSNHTYSIIVTGTGAFLTAAYHDNYYPDNTDQNPGDIPLMVSVYRALPSAPGLLRAQADSPFGDIALSWQNIASDGTHIVIDRSEDGGAFKQIATEDASATSYLDTGVDTPAGSLDANHTYDYRIAVTNTFGQSGFSEDAYAALVRQKPFIAPIAAQVASAGANFTFNVQANNPLAPAGHQQDGLTYAILNTSNTPGLAPLADSPGTFAGWTPTGAQVGQTYQLEVQVTEQGSTGTSPLVTDAFFNVTVAPNISTIPKVTSATAVLDPGNSTKVNLTAVVQYAGPTSDLTYTWSQVQPSPNEMLPSFEANGTANALTTVADLHQSGNYFFKLTVSDGTDWPGVGQTSLVVVGQNPTNLVVTPVAVTVGAGAIRPLTATVFDQFGNAMPTYSPAFAWAFGQQAANGTIQDTGESYNSLPARQTVNYVAPTAASWAPNTQLTDIVNATYTYQSGPTRTSVSISGTANVTVTNSGDQPPTIVQPAAAKPLNATQLRLTVSGADPSGTPSDLTYLWQATSSNPSAPKPQFSVNGTNAAQSVIVTFPPNTTLEYSFTVTVTNPLNEFIQSTTEYADDSHLSQVVLTPQQSSVGQGKTMTYSAVAEDQYNVPMPNQAQYRFNWTVDGQTMQDGSLATYSFTSQNLGPHRVSVSLDGQSQIPASAAQILVVGSGPPIMQIVSPGAATNGTPEIIGSDMPVDIIAFNPNGDPQPWALWLVPTGGDGTAGGPVLLGSSASSVGTPGNPVQVAMIGPDDEAKGSYNLVLASSLVDPNIGRADSNALTLTTSNLTILVPTTAEIDLSWSPSTNVNTFSYAIYRGSTYDFTPSDSTLISYGDTVNSMQDVGLAPGSSYYYKVINLSADGSELSDAVNFGATTLKTDAAAPIQPNFLSADSTNDTEVNLTWTDRGTNTTSDVIWQSADSGSTWTIVGAVPVHTDAFIVSNLDSYTDYTFQVTAINSSTAATQPTTRPTTGPTATTKPLKLGDKDTVVFFIAGHDQLSDMIVDQQQGVGAILKKLFDKNQAGLGNLILIPEIEYKNNGVVNDIEGKLKKYFQQGILNYAFIGYSHGGGVVQDVCNDFSVLAAQNAHILPGTGTVFAPQIIYTAYIDAINRDPKKDDNILNATIVVTVDSATVLAVKNRPVGALENDNYYESHYDFLNGVKLVDFDGTKDFNTPVPYTDKGAKNNHIRIDKQVSIQDSIVNRFEDAYTKYAKKYVNGG